MPAGLDGNPDPIVSEERDRVLDRVTAEIAGRRVGGRPLLVGIDGIDGAGKSTLADELAARLSRQSVPVVRATVDSFHHPRRIRYRRGRTSPAGFLLDSHDLDALRRELLDPFRDGAGGSYRTAVFDEPTDRSQPGPSRTVIGTEVLLFDGIFLARPELAGYWDLLVFLDARKRIDLQRLGLVMADAPVGGPELVAHVLEWAQRLDRYASGLRLYLDRDDPMGQADLVIDNNDLAHPVVVG